MLLFLQGARLIGKSTVLRNELLPHAACVAGFSVQRLYIQGTHCGFRACSVSGNLPPLEAEHCAALGGVFLYQRQEIPTVLEQQMQRTLTYCRQESCKLILLDEIGGMELHSPVFMQALEEIFALNKPCVGVIKSQENLQDMAQRLGLPDTLLENSQELHHYIADNGEILTATNENLAEIQLYMQNFVVKQLGDT